MSEVDSVRRTGLIYQRAARQAGLVCALLGAACGHGQLPERRGAQLDHAPQWAAGAMGRVVHLGFLRGAQDIRSGDMGRAVAEAVLGEEKNLQLIQPTDVSRDAEGRVLVADPALGGVVVFDVERGQTRLVTGDGERALQAPVGVTALDDGRFAVSDPPSARVLIYSVEGHLRQDLAPGSWQRPTGLAWDPARRLLAVVDTVACQVRVFSADGRQRFVFGQRGHASGQLNYPLFLTFDRVGSLWVVDSLNSRVQRFSPDGQPLLSFGANGDAPGFFARAKGIAVDAVGRVFVSDALFGNVQVFDGEGHVLMYFTREGRGEAQLMLPGGMFIDEEQRLWVADSHNSRVQMYRLIARKNP